MTSRARHALLALGAAAALGYLALLASAPLAVRASLKPVPVLCLAAWCWPGRARASTRLVCGGLLASAVGDVLLEMPRMFLPGMAAFLATHLCYTAAFVIEARRWRPLRAVPFLLWGAAGFALLAPVLGALVWPVLGYVLAICVMMWRAAARVGATGARRREEWFALGGAVAFGASDTLLALSRFLTPWPDAPYIVMLLYWAGQAGIARSARPAAGIPAGFLYHHAGPPAA
jgi:alkenylglycerophosphocholine/alkenylglycerophosphoethanolamine hydrolase